MYESSESNYDEIGQIIFYRKRSSPPNMGTFNLKKSNLKMDCKHPQITKLEDAKCLGDEFKLIKELSGFDENKLNIFHLNPNTTDVTFMVNGLYGQMHFSKGNEYYVLGNHSLYGEDSKLMVIIYSDEIVLSYGAGHKFASRGELSVILAQWASNQPLETIYRERP